MKNRAVRHAGGAVGGAAETPQRRGTFRFHEIPMKTLKTAAAAALLMVAATAGSAEKLDVKLGLWELTSLTRISGTPPLPKELLDKMTPQQRADMAARIKEAQEEEPEEDVSSECITAEDLEKPFASADTESCTQTVVRTTRNTQEIRLACTGKTKGSGVFRVTTPTPETMNGELVLQVGEGAQIMTVKGTIKGRWLGADCGDEDDDDDIEDEPEDENEG